MATLGSIIARVESELMYAPDLRAYRLDIRALANARYGLLARERPWPWLQRREPLWVLPDTVVPNAAVSVPSGYGLRSFDIDDTQITTLTGVHDWADHLRPLLAGAEFGVSDRTLVTPGGSSNWEDGPFVIELAQGGTDVTRIHLDPRCNIAAIGSGDGAYKLSFPRYRLPADVDVLERIVDDQGQVIDALNPDRERAYQLDPSRDAGSRPCWVLEDRAGHRPQFAPLVYPGLSDATPPNADQLEDIHSRVNLPLRIAPTVVEGSGGSIVAGTRVKVLMCWWYAGRFGSASPSTEVTIASDSASYAVSGWTGKVIPVSTGATTGAYGRRLAIFTSENDGAYYLRGWVNPAATSSLTISHSVDHASTTALPVPTLKIDGPTALPRYDRVYPGGPYTYVRLYPRPTIAARYELDYQARPAQLLEDTDEPEFPEQYSEVLVWATCLGMADRYARGTDVSVWERNYREWRMRLDQRYMPQMRYRMVKGAHGVAEPWSSWLRRENIRYNG